MANYKTLYNNTLIIELFIRKLAVNPNTAKNKKIIQELLEYGKIAAKKITNYCKMKTKSKINQLPKRPYPKCVRGKAFLIKVEAIYVNYSN